MSLVYLVGEKFNNIEGRNITVSSENSLFPSANLHNGVPSVPFMFSTAATDDTIDVDLNLSLNGDFADWTVASVPDNWTDNSIGTGSLSASSGVCFVDGNNVANYASGYQLVTLKSGYYYTITARGKGDGANPIIARLVNLDTGKHLTSGGVWDTPYQNWIERTTTSYGTTTTTFQVDSYADTLLDTQRCLLWFYCIGNGYIDDFYIWPHWDFVSIHGHNIMPRIAVKTQSDDNASYSSVTTQDTLTYAVPSMYSLEGSRITERYFRLLLDGDVIPASTCPVSLSATTTIGELVIGQSTTPTAGQLIPWSIDYDMPLVENAGQAGQVYRSALSDYDRRAWELAFRRNTAADFTDFETLYRRAQGGKTPGVLVPVSTESPVAYGYFAKSMSLDRSGVDGAIYDWGLKFEEMPHFLSVA